MTKAGMPRPLTKSLKETEEIIFDVVGNVLKKTGIDPQEVFSSFVNPGIAEL